MLIMACAPVCKLKDCQIARLPAQTSNIYVRFDIRKLPESGKS